MSNPTDRALRPVFSSPVPATRAEVEAHRKVAPTKTLNDYVEEIYLLLIEDELFNQYISAVWDEEAIEGSLGADNVMAAELIRDKANELDKKHMLANKKLATIAKSLGVVLRRYEYDRKLRRNMLHGQTVPNAADPNNGGE